MDKENKKERLLKFLNQLVSEIEKSIDISSFNCSVAHGHEQDHHEPYTTEIKPTGWVKIDLDIRYKQDKK